MRAEYSYYGTMHNRFGEVDDEKYLGLTPTEAVKKACRMISDRKGYIVHIIKKNDWTFLRSYDGLVYFDGKAYYKGKDTSHMVRINPATGRAIPKKRNPAPFGL